VTKAKDEEGQTLAQETLAQARAKLVKRLDDALDGLRKLIVVEKYDTLECLEVRRAFGDIQAHANELIKFDGIMCRL
jgi:hypothetical protein